jgi:hypothetical protein
LFEAGHKAAECAALSGLGGFQVFRLRRTAEKRGYNRTSSTVLKSEYVADEPRPGRPKALTKEEGDEIMTLVRLSAETREMSAAALLKQFKVGTNTRRQTL